MHALAVIRRPSPLIQAFQYLSYSTDLSTQRLRQAYLSLDLDENANADEVRQSYARLARRFHPDTGGQNADPARLEHVRNAYKFLMKHLTDSDVADDEVSEEKDFGIKHIVPQHRQYLEHDGIGYGSPFARQRQYQQYRVMNALENVREFTVEKTIRDSQDPNSADLIAMNEQRKRQKHRLTGMIDRVVEDMILQSMSSGGFSNLKGAGKPLKMDESNPYIDGTELRINRILRDNGFSPPWIIKENELRRHIMEYRQKLRDEFAYLIVKSSDGELDRISSDRFDSLAIFGSLTKSDFIDKELITINKLIQNYNLIAPSLDRQFMPLRKDNELTKAKDDVLADFPNSKFIVDATKKHRQQMAKKSEDPSLSKGFLHNLLNRFC